MENFLPTYSEFSKFNDGYRLKWKRKPRNSESLKKIYYPFALIGVLTLHLCMGFLIIGMMQRKRQPEYKTSSDYRKVIKEGVFFDSIEYHQR